MTDDELNAMSDALEAAAGRPSNVYAIARELAAEVLRRGETIATYRAMDRRVADGWYFDADEEEGGLWVRRHLNRPTEYEPVTAAERAILEEEP